MSSPKHQVEALLFSSGKSMTIEQLAELSKLDNAKVKRALKALQKDYESRDCAIDIVGEGDVWKMAVRNEHLTLVSNIVADTELSKACMETLAVIAFKYPNILQSEVVESRGSNAYEHIKELEKLGFLNKKPSGRSYKISLSEKFFQYFEVKGEKDIKKLFKSIKVPDKVGDLDVVDVSEEQKDAKGKPLEGMDVVDVSDNPEIPETVREQREREFAEQEAPELAKVKTTPEEKKAQQAFLEDLDQRIAKLDRRNSEHEADPLLKRPEPEEEEQSEEETPESN